MAQQEISPELVGQSFDPIDVAWEDKDVQLYAIAVGAKPDTELEFIYESKGPKVLPTFCVIPGLNILGTAVGNIRMNLMMLLHGEEKITLHRPLPSTFKGTGQSTIVEVWDKGKAAVIGIECVISDKEGPLATIYASMFIRGAGGFGGERGPSSAETAIAIPEREPDHVVEDETRPEQAALYRLTGDRNPIHIDPDFAKMGGFDKPFLHGLCTFGFAGRAVLKALCDSDPARLVSLSSRFADQVFMGDQVITKVWDEGNGKAIIQVETQKGNVVLNNAVVEYKSE